MERQRDTDVLIVGAGPTGMTLALALEDLGVRAMVLDRQAEGANTSRAAVIHARTLEVLQPLGVTDILLCKGVKVPVFTVRDRDRVLLKIGFDRLPTAYPFTLMCPQDTTEAAMVDRLRARGHEIVRPAEVTAVRSVGGGVEVDVARSGVTQQVRARWVVGCDGGHSVVRRDAGIAFEGAAYHQDFVLADVRLDWPLERDDVSLFFSTEGFLVVAPMPDDRFRIVATVETAPEAPAVDFLQDLVARRGPSHPAGTVRELVWTSRFRLQHRVAEAALKSRTILCGDAAHVHSPAGGQGMNTGIQDAASLAEPLAQALRSGDESGLATWAARRHAIAADVVRTTDRMTRAATLASKPLRIARNTALALVGRVPGATNAIATALSELNYR